MTRAKYFYAADECSGGVTYYIAAKSPSQALELLAGHGALDCSEDGDTLSIQVMSEAQAQERLVWPEDPGVGEKIRLFDAEPGSLFSSEV